MTGVWEPIKRSLKQSGYKCGVFFKSKGTRNRNKWTDLGNIEEVGFRGFNDELDVGRGVRFIT